MARGEEMKGSKESSMDKYDSGTEKGLQKLITQVLKARTFVGEFKEKRLSNVTNNYHDVIYVSNSEIDLIEDLEFVQRRLNNFYRNAATPFWIPILKMKVEQDDDKKMYYSIWSELVSIIPFGYYQFQIKSVKFLNDQLCLSVVNLGEEIDYNNYFKRRKRMNSTNLINSNEISSSTSDEGEEMKADWERLVKEQLESINMNMYWFFKNICTLKNTKETIKFLVALILVIIGGIVKLVPTVGQYSLKLMREITYFTQASTPIIIALIDFVAKIFGGFYLLMAMIFRGFFANQPPPVYRPSMIQPQPPPPNYYQNNF